MALRPGTGTLPVARRPWRGGDPPSETSDPSPAQAAQGQVMGGIKPRLLPNMGARDSERSQEPDPTASKTKVGLGLSGPLVHSGIGKGPGLF